MFVSSRRESRERGMLELLIIDFFVSIKSVVLPHIVGLFSLLHPLHYLILCSIGNRFIHLLNPLHADRRYLKPRTRRIIIHLDIHINLPYLNFLEIKDAEPLSYTIYLNTSMRVQSRVSFQLNWNHSNVSNIPRIMKQDHKSLHIEEVLTKYLSRAAY